MSKVFSEEIYIKMLKEWKYIQYWKVNFHGHIEGLFAIGTHLDVTVDQLSSVHG